MSGRGGVRSSARLSGDAVAGTAAAAATAPAAPGPTVRVPVGRGRPVATTAAAAQRRARAAERAREVEDSPRVLREKCRRLARALRNAKHLVVYTGAGISTAADIPDYRGPDGVWTRLQRGETVGRVEVSRARPTFTHMALTALWARGTLKFVVSQNCDGLHLRSGLPRRALAELHGDMFAELCGSCRRVYLRAFDTTERTARHQHGTRRLCHACGAELRDSIVHFGERGRAAWPLNWAGALRHAARADVVLCLGSSLKVLRRYPRLWRMQSAPRARPALYIVNLQWTPKDSVAALKINARCDAVMQQVARRLRLRVPRYRAGKDPVLAHAEPLAAPENHTTRRPLLRAPAEPEDSASDEWEPSSPSASDSDEELPLRRLADRLRGPSPDRPNGPQLNRPCGLSVDHPHGLHPDRPSGIAPDYLPRPTPGRPCGPGFERLRVPAPDRFRALTDPNFQRGPAHDRLRESIPDSVCGNKIDRLPGPISNRFRGPIPDRFRGPNGDRYRSPLFDRFRGPVPHRQQGPVPEHLRRRVPSNLTGCGSVSNDLPRTPIFRPRGPVPDSLRDPNPDRLHSLVADQHIGSERQPEPALDQCGTTDISRDCNESVLNRPRDPTPDLPQDSRPDPPPNPPPDLLLSNAPDQQEDLPPERLRAFKVNLKSGEATILLRLQHAPSPPPPGPSPPRCRTTDLRKFRMTRHGSDPRPLTINGRSTPPDDPCVSPMSLPDDAKATPVNGAAGLGSRLRQLLEYEPRINASENAKRPTVNSGTGTELEPKAIKMEVKMETKVELKMESKLELKDELKRDASSSDEERGALAAGSLAAAIIRRAMLLCRASLYPGLHTIIAPPAPVPRPASATGLTGAECAWCARHYSSRRCLWYGPPRDPPPSARAWRRVRGRRYLCACCGAGQSPPRQTETGPDEGGWYGKGYRKGRRRRR